MQMYTRGLGSKSVTVYGYSTEPHSLYGHCTLYNLWINMPYIHVRTRIIYTVCVASAACRRLQCTLWPLF